MRGLIIMCLCIVVISTNAQQKAFTPQVGKKPVAFCKTPLLRSIEPILKDEVKYNQLEQEAHHPKHGTDRFMNHKKIDFIDPVIQDYEGVLNSPPLNHNFDGLGPMDNTCHNPDTEGDVGPNHYMQMVKRSFAIWDKEGNLLYGPANNKTLWSTLPGPWHDHKFTDPIVVYDHLTDRWLASNMVYEISSLFVYWEVIAISATPDPLGEWYCYAYEFDYMPDYPKFGVWNNEYIMTINNADFTQPGVPFMGTGIWAFNKQDLMNGEPEPGVVAFLVGTVNNDFYLSPSSFLPADVDGLAPPLNSPNYLAYVKDDNWGFDFDFISLWECEIDWEVPENSTLNEISVIEVEPFMTNTINPWYIAQPEGPKLDALGDRLMYRLQYRKFDGYEMMITNQTVILDTNDHAGIRWYELRNYGNGWAIYQQSTFVPDSQNRWMGSIAMDNRGNMALGYSVSGSEVYPSIRITGRFDTDILGTMSLEENEVATGEGYQINHYRWGDYSCMTIDPVDDQTFWYTQMYMPETGQFGWETKICSFKIAKELAIESDTIYFETIEECTEGKVFTIKNNSWDTIEVNYIEQEGTNLNSIWYIDEMPVILPYSLSVGDSVEFLVKVDYTVQGNPEGFIFDCLDITANITYDYGIIIALNEELLTNQQRLPHEIRNLRIYPNPFRNETLISFDLDMNSDVEIKIYDQQYKEVITILDFCELKTGQHSFYWKGDGENKKLPSNTYYCELMVNSNSLVRKIIFTR